MTTLERNQPTQVFKDAGRHAFLIGVHVSDNPYKEQPYRGLWEQGFKQTKAKSFKNKFQHNNKGRKNGR